MPPESPDIVRLSLAEVQTLRGAFNAIDELTTKNIPLKTRVWDPTRLIQLRNLNDYFANRMVSMAADSSAQFQVDATERQVIRTAIEQLTHTELADDAAGETIFDVVGLSMSREDADLLSSISSKVEPPEPDDLALSDLRYGALWIQGWPTPLQRRVDRAKGDVTDSMKLADEPQYNADHAIAVLEDHFVGQLGYGCIGDFEAFYDFAWIVARGSKDTDTERQRLQDVAYKHAENGLSRLRDNQCGDPVDRDRLRFAVSNVLGVLARGYESGPMLNLVDMVGWTRYRMNSGLSTPSPDYDYDPQGDDE